MGYPFTFASRTTLATLTYIHTALFIQEYNAVRRPVRFPRRFSLFLSDAGTSVCALPCGMDGSVSITAETSSVLLMATSRQA